MKDIQNSSEYGAKLVIKKGEVIARVLSHYSKGGRVTVNILQYGDAAKNTAMVMGLELDEYGIAPSEAHFQSAYAGGYGYDKYTAALSGLVIDGHKLGNHCGTDDRIKRLFKRYQKAAANGNANRKEWESKAAKIGAYFANWKQSRESRIAHLVSNGCQESDARNDAANYPENGQYTSLYKREGLNYLRDIGYTIIDVL